MQFFYNLLYGKINKKSSTCVTSTMIRSFMYRAFASCIVRSFRVSFVCVFRIVRSFHFVRVSCVFRIVRSFRLRLVRIISLYDPGSVQTTGGINVIYKIYVNLLSI